MRVQWSHEAARDLDRPYEYIAADNPRAASTVEHRIIDAAARPDLFLNRGRPVQAENTRELVVVRTPYIVVYVVEEQALFILHVVHGKRLWPPADRR